MHIFPYVTAFKSLSQVADKAMIWNPCAEEVRLSPKLRAASQFTAHSESRLIAEVLSSFEGFASKLTTRSWLEEPEADLAMWSIVEESGQKLGPYPQERLYEPLGGS